MGLFNFCKRHKEQHNSSLIFLLELKIKSKQHYFCVCYISIHFFDHLHLKQIYTYGISITPDTNKHAFYLHSTVYVLQDISMSCGRKHSIFGEKVLSSYRNIDSNLSSALNFTFFNP